MRDEQKILDFAEHILTLPIFEIYNIEIYRESMENVYLKSN